MKTSFIFFLKKKTQIKPRKITHVSSKLFIIYILYYLFIGRHFITISQRNYSLSRKNRTLAGTSSWPQVQPQSMGLCDTTKGECKENPPEVQILPCWEHSGRGRWRRERPTVPWWSDLTYCKGENGQKLNNESSYKIWKKKWKFKTVILLSIECFFYFLMFQTVINGKMKWIKNITYIIFFLQ